MRTLVYKRTHNGDPDSKGQFGIYDCMGQVRSLGFEAVIGVGGQGAQAKKHDIAYKLTWIGIGRHDRYVAGMNDPIVTFDHFLYFGPEGDLLELHAPQLAKRLYRKHPPRYILDDFSAMELAEIELLLKMAEDADPSGAMAMKVAARKRPLCPPASKRPKRLAGGIC